MPIGSSRRRSCPMPTGKRASMREGPLAALFRKTAQDVEDKPEGGERPAPAGEERQSPPAAAAPPEPSEPAEPAVAPGSPVEPTLSAAPPEPEVDEPRIPLPHERLR